MPSQPQSTVDTFANPAPERDYQVEFSTNEFTCVCPLTGQPDFATLHIVYVPDRWCVELKSLKLYLWSFRNEGHFHEAVTNQILSHLVKVLSPRSITVKGIFNIRGGIQTTVSASYHADNQGQP